MWLEVMADATEQDKYKERRDLMSTLQTRHSDQGKKENFLKAEMLRLYNLTFFKIIYAK